MQFYSTLYSLQQIVASYKLQVYSILDSLQEIVVTYKLQIYSTFVDTSYKFTVH